MARLTDELMERVTAAALRLSDGRVEELVAQAQAEAEAEVKEVFKSAIKAALLRRAVARLEPIDAASRGRGGAEREGNGDRDESPGSAPSADRAGRSPQASESHDGERTLRYLYCITRNAGRLPSELRGVNDTSCFDVVRFEEVEAITSPVSPTAFSEDAIRGSVQDPEWLAREVRAHERVLQAAMAGGAAVVPFRFCTVLRGRDAVAEVLRAHHGAIREALASFAGHGEWGVKIYYGVSGDDGMSDANAGPGDTTGRAYLARRHRALRSREADVEAARAGAGAVHERLSALARSAVEIPGRAGRLAGEDEAAAELLLNAAYLVPDGGVAAFHAAIAASNEQYASEGLTCEVTGPWPPYSFVNLDLSLPAAR